MTTRLNKYYYYIGNQVERKARNDVVEHRRLYEGATATIGKHNGLEKGSFIMQQTVGVKVAEYKTRQVTG